MTSRPPAPEPPPAPLAGPARPRPGYRSARTVPAGGAIMKVQVVFYSMYGHIYRMAEAIAEGARQVEGAEVALFQVAELVPEAALEKSGAKAARQAFAHVPLATPAQLADA